MTDLAIYAVVITFNPDTDFPNRIAGIAKQVDSILVIDNASGPQGQALLAKLRLSKHLKIIRNPDNVGIATALNIGMHRARTLKYRWALVLDQDSDAAPNMVADLTRQIQSRKWAERAAIVAPQTVDSVSRKPSIFLRPRFGIFYHRSACEGEVMEVTTAISSGSLVNLRIHDELGGFRDDYFIDYIDTEYCLRAQMHGYVILAACKAKLIQKLGERTEWHFGPLHLFPTFYPPSRWYTISRNRMAIWRAYAARFPHWLSYDLLASAFITIRMLLAEGHRGAKVRAILRGTLDGVAGRMGGPEATVSATRK